MLNKISLREIKNMAILLPLKKKLRNAIVDNGHKQSLYFNLSIKITHKFLKSIKILYWSKYA